LGKQDNSSVTVHLLSSIALPILTYGLKALAPNKTDIILLDHSWSRAFMKIYGTFDKEIVKQCQFYTGTLTLLPVAIHVVSVKFRLLNNSLLQFLFDVNRKTDIINLAFKCNTTYEHFVKQLSKIYDE